MTPRRRRKNYLFLFFFTKTPPPGWCIVFRYTCTILQHPPDGGRRRKLLRGKHLRHVGNPQLPAVSRFGKPHVVSRYVVRSYDFGTLCALCIVPDGPVRKIRFLTYKPQRACRGKYVL